MPATASRLTSPASVLFTVLLFCAGSFGQVETALYSFVGGSDGSNPNGALVADSAGNLYGTVPSKPFGNVFELSPPAVPGGAWTKTILHNFAGAPHDGENWPASTLTFDQSGNLFGVTCYGGENGAGTVFELIPPTVAGDAWTEKILYNFPKGYTQGNGEYPGGRLTFDGAGNLYGAAAGGIGDCFSNGCGVIFQIKKPATPGGAWRGRVIYDFGQYSGDASTPEPGFVFRSGSLYGVSAFGGAYGLGAFFELSQSQGVWSETILYSFSGVEATPAGNLIIDEAGNFYTSTYGSFGYGAVVMLSPPAVAGDPWTATDLHSFSYPGDDGIEPNSGVVRDKDNNLYGTNAAGATGGWGTVFKLIPPSVAGGAWIEKTLYYFGDHPHINGVGPTSALILISGQGLFSTTSYGGTSDDGTIFNLKP